MANGPNSENLVEIIPSKSCNYSNYTRLLIKGSFKTTLPYASEIAEGNYGLRLILTYVQNNTEIEQETTLFLDNKNDMIGNVYSFGEYFEQS